MKKNILQWKNPKIDGYPKDSNRRCFIKVNNDIQIAYWNQKTNSWYNTTYGQIPDTFDDSGGRYKPYIYEWAYIPKDFFES